MNAAAFRVAMVQALGRLALLLSFGVLVAALLFGLVLPPNPTAAFADAWTHRQALINSVQTASGATIVAIVIGGWLAAAYSLSTSRIWRRLMMGGAIFAVLTMPSVYGYAALLLGSSDFPLLGGFDQTVRNGAPIARRAAAAIVMAFWLWPVAFLLLAAALRRGGHALLNVAVQDAKGLRAWRYGHWPVLRGPLLSAALVTFVLATTEATIAPLFIPQETLWAPEMMAQASLARGDLVAGLRPNAMGYLLRHSWPLLALQLGLIAIAGWRAWRRHGIANTFVEADGSITVHAGMSSGRRWLMNTTAGLLLALLVIGPLMVFVRLLLNDQRYRPTEAFTSVWQTAAGPIESSAIVAAFVAFLSFALALAFARGFASDQNLRARRRFGDMQQWTLLIVAIVCFLCAALPSSVVATGITQVFGAGPWGDPSGWNIYDDMPAAWIAAMLVRFSFIPLTAGILAARSAPVELIQTARIDGASELTAWIVGGWPFVWRPMAAGAAFAAALSLIEAPTSLLTAPTRWGHGSLAAYVDQQMHYERHGQTLALTLMLYSPALLLMGGWLVVSTVRSRYHTEMK